MKNYTKTKTGKWHKAYEQMPNPLSDPVFYGKLYVDMRKNTLEAFPESGVLELDKVIMPYANFISQEGYLISEFKPAVKIESKRYNAKRRQTSNTTILKGTTLVLLSGGIGNPVANYGHFALDVAARVHFFLQAGFELSQLEHIVGPKTTASTEFLLQQVGVPIDKYVHYDENSIIQIETALAPSFPGAPRNYPSWLPKFYQDSMPSLKKHSTQADLRLYISCEGYTRNPTNKVEVERILRQHHFEIIDSRHTTEQEIINKFRRATIVVGSHGAGLTNIMFCRPFLTQLLELVPTDHVQPYFYSLAQAANVAYHCLVCASTQQCGSNPYGPSPYDFYVDEQALNNALTQLENKRISVN